MVKRYRQDFLVGNAFLGTVERNGDASWNPRSYAFFCDHCAEVWARCPLTDQYYPNVYPFQVLTCRCVKHPYEFSSAIPGSLHLSWDKDFSNSFPDDVIRYEFAQALKLFPVNADQPNTEQQGEKL